MNAAPASAAVPTMTASQIEAFRILRRTFVESMNELHGIVMGSAHAAAIEARTVDFLEAIDALWADTRPRPSGS